MSTAIHFNLVNRDNLPPDLLYKGRYGTLLAVAASLDEHKVIHIPANGGGSKETLRIYVALSYKFKKDPRFARIQLKQRDGQLWIFKQGEDE